MELDEFYGGERTIKVKAGSKGQVLTVTYDPAAISYARLLRMTDIEFLVAVLKSWDLTDKGHPVLLTAEALGELPREFLRTAVGWIRADLDDIPKEKWTLSLAGSASSQAAAPPS